MELAGLLLGILGLFGWPLLWRAYQNTVLRTWYKYTWTEDRVREEASVIVARSTLHLPRPHDAATYANNRIVVSWFIDLLTAMTRPSDRKALEHCLVRWLRIHRMSRPDRIAVPKLGNVLLADAVAQRLEKPLTIVRQEQKHNIRGTLIDGDLTAGDRVLLIDDVASDPVFLRRCVDYLHKHQAVVIGIIVVVDRIEGQCVAEMEPLGVPLKAILSLDDAALSQTVPRARAEAIA